jgi:Tol biopolymer transport system component
LLSENTSRTHLHFERFDYAALVLAALIVIAIVVTVAVGDRAGVGVVSIAPQGQAHTTSTIHVSFAEPMDSASVEKHFVISPPAPGKFSWNGPQLTFAPVPALAAGQTYTVTVQAGAASTQGRLLTQDMRWTFTVRRSRVAYLAPAIHDDPPAPPNLWTVDPADPTSAKQITFNSAGIFPDYAASPDGTRIAFAQPGADGTADLYLMTLDTGAIQRVTRCVDASCQSPSWSPDGTRIVYERVELNTNLQQLDRGVPRAWIVNLNDLSTTPLLVNSQLLGKQPRWSPDGSQIAVYDQNAHGTIIYNLTDGSSSIITSAQDETGLFDPSGKRMVYPDLLQTQIGFSTTLAIADLGAQQVHPLTSKDQASVDDRQAAWTPDGKLLAVTRRYLDESQTAGAQVYLINPDTAEVQPLIKDPQYNHGAIAWDPTGNQLVMQRFPTTNQDGQPSIWVYNMQTKAIREIATNAYLPQWIP